MNVHKVSTRIGDRDLTIETGKLAKQADGAVIVSYGDTVVLVTACADREPREGLDFFPLTVVKTSMPPERSPADFSSVKANLPSAKSSTAA